MTTITDLHTYDNRSAFADTLIELAASNPRILAVCNDSVGSSNLVGFRDRYPERLINVGIAEQDMVGVGAGLASSGFIPFVCGAGPFLTGRALEQIKADVAYSQHKVVLCSMSPGMAYGELGPTHHSIEDYSWLRPLGGLDIAVPADRHQTRQALEWLAAEPRPTYLRIGRYKVPDVTDPDTAWERGRMITARDGDDVTLIGIGTGVSIALDAADALAGQGISARVLNAAWLSPFDEAALLRAAHETRAIVTVEEAHVAGGLGAAVASVLAQQPGGSPCPMRMIGVTGFAPTGSTSMLLEYFGITTANVAHVATELLNVR